MSTLSRRHLVTTAVALPALAVVAAVPALATPIAPLVELDPVIELAEGTIKTWDEFGAAIRAAAPFEKLQFDWRDKNPPPEKPKPDGEVTESQDAAGNMILHIRTEARARSKRKQALYDRAYKSWERRKTRFEKSCGYDGAFAKQDEIGGTHRDVRDQLEEARPRTWAGLVAKARAARHLDQDETLCQQIAFDIGIMAGEVEPEAAQS
jgi:hypothetical protein